MNRHLVITVQEASEWCRIDVGADIALLETLIFAAQQHASIYLGARLDPVNCPRPIKQAIAIMVADLYANREGQAVGMATFDRLLAPHRGMSL